MTAFDAAEIVRGIGDLYEPLADDKGITLAVEAPAATFVRGNRELISQALANLVDNAIKYGTADGAGTNGRPAEILLTAAEQGDRVRLSVADHGAGIAPSDRGRVLERFVRLEQSRSEPGSGLGLSLASAIARLHGGELVLEDNHPGLVSVLVLPRVAAPVPTAA
jgi:signal transduction histidine kinase